MTLNKNQRLVCAGQMPLRAPDGTQLAAVPVYKIVPADNAGECPAAELLPSECLVLVGSEINKAAAEERYNALIAGENPPKLQPTPLYIKEPAENADPATGLTEGEKRALNPLIGDLLCEFSAAMREREALGRQGKRVRHK